MRRFLLAAAAFGVIVALGAPAPAADLKAGGTMKVKHIITTETGGGQLYPIEDMKTKRLTTARMNPRLEFLATEKSGMVWVGEIDTDFGDRSYYTSAGDGGGLAADTVNVETKNAYIHFDIAETPLSFRAGITGVVDSYNFVIAGTDMAGFRLLADMGNTKINLDWLRWWDDNEVTDGIVDDVDFWMATLNQKLGAFNVGASFYYLKDGSGLHGKGLLNNGPGVRTAAPTAAGATPGTVSGISTAGNATGGKSLNYLMYNVATGNSPIIPAGIRYDLDSFYPGVFGSGMLGPVAVDGSFVYNFGTVKVDNSTSALDDADIQAFLFDLRGSMKVADANVSLEGIYVSGDDKQVGKGDFGLVTANQYQYAGAFYLRHGMMILLPDADDINNSNALVYDPANVYENTYLGMWGLFLNANMNLPMNLNAKVGVGYVSSSEDRLVNGNKAIGTELNGTLTYTVAKGTTIYLNGAYCWTGDFYEVSSAEAASYNAKVDSKQFIGGKLAANTDPDDVWYTSVVFRVAM